MSPEIPSNELQSGSDDFTNFAYSEIRDYFRLIDRKSKPLNSLVDFQPNDIAVDLGAGKGNSAVVLTDFFPQIKNLILVDQLIPDQPISHVNSEYFNSKQISFSTDPRKIDAFLKDAHTPQAKIVLLAHVPLYGRNNTDHSDLFAKTADNGVVIEIGDTCLKYQDMEAAGFTLVAGFEEDSALGQSRVWKKIVNSDVADETRFTSSDQDPSSESSLEVMYEVQSIKGNPAFKEVFRQFNDSQRQEFKKDFPLNAPHYDADTIKNPAFIDWRNDLIRYGQASKLFSDLNHDPNCSNDSFVQIVRRDGEIIGIDVCGIDQDMQKTATYMVIAHNHQRQGLGSELLHKRIEHLKSLGIKEITMQLSKKGRGLIKKSGYRIVEETTQEEHGRNMVRIVFD